MNTRLGGIFSLERLARDSAVEHPIAMEALAVFVRANTSAGACPPGQPPRADIQTALTAIGRRDTSRDRAPIDLHGACLAQADLRNARLGRANLIGTNLTGASLVRANLDRALLVGANLGRADLTDAFLGGADLTGALLGPADTTRASFVSARLVGVDLDGAGRHGIDIGSSRVTVTGCVIANNGRYAYWDADPAKDLSVPVSGAAGNGAGKVRITTGEPHGWETGDRVTVEAVTGTTEANGKWRIAVVDATRFDCRTWRSRTPTAVAGTRSATGRASTSGRERSGSWCPATCSAGSPRASTARSTAW